MSNFKLRRSNTNVMLGGICGGLGEALGIDPTIIRLIVALLALGSCGTVAVIYFIMLLIVPKSDIM